MFNKEMQFGHEEKKMNYIFVYTELHLRHFHKPNQGQKRTTTLLKILKNMPRSREKQVSAKGLLTKISNAILPNNY